MKEKIVAMNVMQKEINDYPNYIIYSDGRVQNKKSKRFLKGCDNNTGYLFISLCKNNKRKSHSIHRLVAIHFIPNPDNLPCVDHKYGNKLDNNISNLRWVSSGENTNGFQKVRSDNTSGNRNIFYERLRKKWRFQRVIYGKVYIRRFKTKDEAIEYRRLFYEQHKLVD